MTVVDITILMKKALSFKRIQRIFRPLKWKILFIIANRKLNIAKVFKGPFVKINLLLCLFIFGFIITATSQEKKKNGAAKTVFKYGGYVKLDVLSTWYNNGIPGNTSPIRDFILPSHIPVGEINLYKTLDFHVKESRINFDVVTQIKNKKIHCFMEMDFLLSSTGDERVSNSFNPRLRQFYFEMDRLLIGQTWSTFMIVIIPDDLDFAGSLEGLIFIRQPLIRYTAGSWMFALENPESLVYSTINEDQIVSDREFLPDVVVRKNFGGHWGTWSIAGLYRTISTSDSLGTYRSPAFGITTGGKLNVGKRGDDIRLTISAGSGLGRYQAANFIAAAVYTNSSKIQTLNSINGYIAFNHFWIPSKLSSSFNIGYFQLLDSGQSLALNTNDIAASASVNIKYDPIPGLRFGIEYSWAGRQLLSTSNGYLNRIQVSAKYRFGYTTEQAIEK